MGLKLERSVVYFTQSKETIGKNNLNPVCNGGCVREKMQENNSVFMIACEILESRLNLLESSSLTGSERKSGKKDKHAKKIQ